MCEYSLKGVCSYLFNAELIREKYVDIYSDKERIPIFKQIFNI